MLQSIKRRTLAIFTKKDRGGNTPFDVLKFETLYQGAENEDFQIITSHLPQNKREKFDPRVPNKSMSVLRQTGFNEVPQLLNILRGEMSIVGPRPLPAYFLDQARDLFPDLVYDWSKSAQMIKPGIVGTSPLRTRRLPITEFDRIAQSDIDYAKNATFWHDISIISQSILAVSRIDTLMKRR